MTEVKFLSDGRKVAVIGKLNNAEYIVQEIFITAKGDEIPSGESFTTKSLHDAPVESYYKKEERRQKESTERAKSELKKTQEEIKRYDGLLNAKKDLLANSPELKDLFGERARIMAMFMTGTVKYLVVDSYELTKPQAMEERLISWENKWGEVKYDAIKLASFLGQSKGDISFRIHQYSDGSGCGQTEVFPFETYEEAVNKIKEIALNRINKGHISEKDLEVCRQLGISFSEEVKEKITLIRSESILRNIESATKRKAEAIKEEKELQDKLDKLVSEFI